VAAVCTETCTEHINNMCGHSVVVWTTEAGHSHGRPNHSDLKF